MTNRTSSIFLPLLLLITAVVTQPGRAEDTPKFRFGVSAPLSGVLAEYGAAVRNGLQLLQEDFPEQSAHVEIILEDSQWDPKAAVSVFNWLKDVKKAQLIYNWGNPTSEAVAPIAEANGFPLLTMSSDHKITEGRSKIIRTLNSAADLGILLGSHIKATEVTKLGAVVAENSYVQGLYEGLEQSLKDSKVKLELVQKFNPDDRDFKTTISRIKLKKFDGLAIFLISGQVQTFFNQMHNQGFKVQTFGADFFGSKSEIKGSGPGMEGAVFPDLAVTEAFRDKYLKRFGNNVQISFAANAYDVGKLVLENFSETGASDFSSQAVLERLKNAKPVNGAHGTFEFKNHPKFGPAFYSGVTLRKISSGEAVDIRK